MRDYFTTIEETKPLIKEGTKFRFEGYLYHVLGIFDEEEVAVKYFGKHKQFWHYEFMDMYKIGYNIELGRLVIK